MQFNNAFTQAFPHSDARLLNINKCFATNPIVVVVFFFYFKYIQTFKNRKSFNSLTSSFLSIQLLKTHPGLTVLTLAVLNNFNL